MNLKIADFFVGTFSGALVAGMVSYISPPFMPMFLGGLIGMLLVIPLKIALMPLFGAFKVMIPLSIIGMTVGMGAGMFSFTTVSSNAEQKPGLRPHPKNDVAHHRIFTRDLPRPQHRQKCRTGRVQNSLAQKCLSRYR